MRDRLAARHFALGALDIDMDPLMVAGRVGEFVDLLLADRVPVADPDLLAGIPDEILRPFDFQHAPAPRLSCALCSRFTAASGRRSGRECAMARRGGRSRTAVCG